jgi:hypothetical protein
VAYLVPHTLCGTQYIKSRKILRRKNSAGALKCAPTQAIEKADEVSVGVYRVAAIHDQGYPYEESGMDPDQLLERAKEGARKINGSRKG